MTTTAFWTPKVEQCILWWYNANTQVVGDDNDPAYSVIPQIVREICDFEDDPTMPVLTWRSVHGSVWKVSSLKSSAPHADSTSFRQFSLLSVLGSPRWDFSGYVLGFKNLIDI